MKAATLASFALLSTLLLFQYAQAGDPPAAKVHAQCVQITPTCNGDSCPYETYAGAIYENTDGSFTSVDVAGHRIDRLREVDKPTSNAGYTDVDFVDSNGNTVFDFLSYPDSLYQITTLQGLASNLAAEGSDAATGYRFSDCTICNPRSTAAICKRAGS